LVLALVLVPHLMAQSQATTGVIEGIVLDPEGAVRPGAAVAVTNTATNFTQNLVTDANGRFRALQLPLGPYRVTVTLAGFATLVREGISLSVGQTVSLTLRLEVSGVQQEVRVTAEAPVVATSRTEGATIIPQEAVQKLPDFNHNYLEFTKLTPGVSVVQGPDSDELTINGQKGIQNNISVDGADFNNPFFGEQRGGTRPPFTFNLDAVQEVVVVADGANAEFGRSSSGFVNVVTKSGTNDIHGSAHFYFTNDSLAAQAPKPDGSFAPKPDGDRYQVGFTFGGPLMTDRLFYFLAGDYQDGKETKQLDPTRIEQRVVDALAALGSPNENAPITRTDDALALLAKVDWRFLESHLATLRYVYTWAFQENGTFDVDSWGTSANAIEKVFSKALTGSILSTFSANLSNEFRFQFAREDRPRPYNGPNAIATGRPLPDTAFDFGSTYRFGMPFFIPVDYHDDRTQFVENVSLFLGQHTFKAGVEFNRNVSSQIFRGFINGRYIFDSTDGFLDYLQNPSHQEHVLLFIQQAGVGDTTAEEAGTQSIPSEEWGVFLQDTWQPMPNLTINLGLRWEAQIEPDLITPIDELFYADFIGQTRNGQEFPGDGTIPSDKNMWQPRVGIAWDPTKDGKTVVRGTFGIFAARIPGLVTASSRSTDGSRGQEIDRPPGSVPPYPFLIPASEIGGTPNHPGVFLFDKNFENPKTMAWSLSAEREVITNLSLLLKYNWAEAKHLTRFVNRNAAELGSPWSTGLGEDGTNGLGGMTTIESTAKSRYWGITFGANKRYSDRFGMQFFYTYSKDRSDDDNERDPFSLRYAKIFEDPNDPTAEFTQEYGYSDRDQRHRFQGWLLWKMPLDIDFNARYSYRSAQPKSITATGEDAGSFQARINPDGTVTQRNLGRKDNSLSTFDLRISRVFAFGGFLVEPSMDIFNLFNAKNFLVPQVTNLVFNFDGTVRSGSGQPRRFQFGLRLAW
ncbi:MAG: TonB-dependent receptor, partial [Thermoanaerobaculia bacterium]